VVAALQGVPIAERGPLRECPCQFGEPGAEGEGNDAVIFDRPPNEGSELQTRILRYYPSILSFELGRAQKSYGLSRAR